MAQKKGGGVTRNGRDSQAKRLGMKKFGNELVSAGCILMRQRGTKIYPGVNVGCGTDHTLYALKNGVVKYFDRKNKKYATIIEQLQEKDA